MKLQFNEKCLNDLGKLVENPLNRGKIETIKGDNDVLTGQYFHDSMCEPYRYYSCDYSEKYLSHLPKRNTLKTKSTTTIKTTTTSTTVDTTTTTTTTTMLLMTATTTDELNQNIMLTSTPEDSKLANNEVTIEDSNKIETDKHKSDEPKTAARKLEMLNSGCEKTRISIFNIFLFFIFMFCIYFLI